MKYLILIFLMVASSVSWANWELVYKFDDSQVYLQRSKKIRQGSMVQIWSSVNFDSEQVDQKIGKYHSWKALEIFDCDKKKRGYVSFTYFGAKNRQGNIVNSMSRPLSEVSFKDVDPGTISALFYTLACEN